MNSLEVIHLGPDRVISLTDDTHEACMIRASFDHKFTLPAGVSTIPMDKHDHYVVMAVGSAWGYIFRSGVWNRWSVEEIGQIYVEPPSQEGYLYQVVVPVYMDRFLGHMHKDLAHEVVDKFSDAGFPNLRAMETMLEENIPSLKSEAEALASFMMGS